MIGTDSISKFYGFKSIQEATNYIWLIIMDWGNLQSSKLNDGDDLLDFTETGVVVAGEVMYKLIYNDLSV